MQARAALKLQEAKANCHKAGVGEGVTDLLEELTDLGVLGFLIL